MLDTYLLLLLLVASAAAPPPLTLSTGTLSFAGPFAPTPGPWVLSFSPASLGAAQPSLEAALRPCGTLAGFLPPASFLLHLAVPATCLPAVSALPRALGAAPLPRGAARPAAVRRRSGAARL